MKLVVEEFINLELQRSKYVKNKFDIETFENKLKIRELMKSEKLQKNLKNIGKFYKNILILKDGKKKVKLSTEN